VDGLLGLVQAAHVVERDARLGLQVVGRVERVVDVDVLAQRRRLGRSAELPLEVRLQRGHAIDHAVVLGPLEQPRGELEVPGREGGVRRPYEAVPRERVALEQELVVLLRLLGPARRGQRVGEQQAQLVVVGRELEGARERLDLVPAHRAARRSSQRCAAGAAVQL
jgi:hypothetical protein